MNSTWFIFYAAFLILFALYVIADSFQGPE